MSQVKTVKNKKRPLQGDGSNEQSADLVNASASTSKAKSGKNQSSKKQKIAKPIKKKKACGLCGKTRKLMITDCCDNWICDDEHNYRLFSYSLDSCARNHRRYSNCAFHYNEGHTGKWQDCKQCEEDACGDDTYDIE